MIYHITPPPSSSQPSTPPPFCGYRRLCSIALFGALLYISGDISGYNRGAKNNNVVNNKGSLRAAASISSFDVDISASTWTKRMNNQNDDGTMISAGKAFSGDDEPVLSKHEVKPKSITKEGDTDKSPASMKMMLPSPKAHVTSINLIGERHSGTNWITDHLIDCFGDQIQVETRLGKRFKHWFQQDDPTTDDSALVIAMFRDPYDWIEAMRERPHHAHEHIGRMYAYKNGPMNLHEGLPWKEFVSKPWIGPRGAADQAKIEMATKNAKNADDEALHLNQWVCLGNYTFNEVVPCSPKDSEKKEGFANYMYELRHDKSGLPYESIINLRSAKVRNFMEVPNYHGVEAFLPQRYEALAKYGTADLLMQVEEISGLKAQCTPVEGSGEVKHKSVPQDYMEWMNERHDWDAEAMIGYYKRSE